MPDSSQRVIPIVSQAQVQRQQDLRAGQRLTSLPPLSLYVHVPWCIKKCPYCDFNSHRAPENVPEQAYLAALTQDLDQALPLIWGRQIHTIFIGGGTPSLLSDRVLDELLAMIRARVPLWPDAEITLEANPGAAESSRFVAYAQSGVNRISLGIQSFHDEHLGALGRAHDAREACAAIEMATNAVSRVNLDLMYGLPGQEVRHWEADLQRAIGFETEHLSLYQLTLEPQTVFAKYPPPLPDESLIEQMEQSIDAIVVHNGWHRYEVSAYAKPGAACRHNLNYWTFGDYLGIGPGAHSKISFPDQIVRQARTRNPEQWMQATARGDASHIAEKRVLSEEDLPFEFFLNALRLQDGVPAQLFVDHTGMALSDIEATVEDAQKKGLLRVANGKITPTTLGWRHLNSLQSLFLA